MLQSFSSVSKTLFQIPFIPSHQLINQSIKSFHNSIEGIKAPNNENYLIHFTCAKCNHKTTRTFTKHAYHKGVVLIKCFGCQGIHLIADNLGWFDDSKKTIEDILKGKGISFNKTSLQKILEATKNELNNKI